MLWMVSSSMSFNPDWAPHFIPTATYHAFPHLPERVSIPTGHHTSFRPDATVGDWIVTGKVSIPTGHHTSFRHGIHTAICHPRTASFNPDWAPHFIPTQPQLPQTWFLQVPFQSRLGTTLHSDTELGCLHSHRESFNPDWAPHFIPTLGE